MAWEFFEHTADLGLRVRAERLEELFAEAARGLFAMIVEEPESIRETTSLRIELAADGLDYLLFDWLAELLAVFDTRHLLCCRFDVTLDAHGRRLAATVGGEPLDPKRHRLDHEVKAVTYHGLRLQKQDGGWEAEVIVDV